MNIVNKSKKKDIRIAIYANLPSGGAYNLFKKNVKFLNDQELFSVIKIFNLEPKPIEVKNLLHYLISILSIKFNSRKLAKTINNSFDVALIYHSWITKSPIILRYLNIPTIYVCHEPPREFYDQSLKKIKTAKEKLVDCIRYPVKLIDFNNIKKRYEHKNFLIITNSQFSKKVIDKIYGVKSRIIYPGINPYPSNTAEKIKRQNIILTVGSINKIKNQLFILKAVSLIPQSFRPKIVFVGNGFEQKYIDYLYKYAYDKNLSLKIFINLPFYKLKKLYLTSKILVFNPINEPFGLVVLEAMSYGLPIITNNKIGASEILRNTQNVLLNPDEHVIWSQKILELITNSKKLESISLQNKQIANKYSTHHMNVLFKKAILDIYKQQ